MVEKFPFAFKKVDKNGEKLMKNNETSALNVITTRDEMQEKDPSCEKQYLPCQQRNFCGETSPVNLLKRELNRMFQRCYLFIFHSTGFMRLFQSHRVVIV